MPMKKGTGHRSIAVDETTWRALKAPNGLVDRSGKRHQSISAFVKAALEDCPAFRDYKPPS